MAGWYFMAGERRGGPVSVDGIRTQVQQGALNSSSLVWREGMADWTPLGQVAELAPPQTLSAAEAAERARRSPQGSETQALVGKLVNLGFILFFLAIAFGGWQLFQHYSAPPGIRKPTASTVVDLVGGTAHERFEGGVSLNQWIPVYGRGGGYEVRISMSIEEVDQYISKGENNTPIGKDIYVFDVRKVVKRRPPDQTSGLPSFEEQTFQAHIWDEDAIPWGIRLVDLQENSY